MTMSFYRRHQPSSGLLASQNQTFLRCKKQ
uniref:Uncharacterized protein n=1 Tax=Anguilla anguilla TaxID=7936 RepID=A0A0E9WI71_ANGAN